MGMCFWHPMSEMPEQGYCRLTKDNAQVLIGILCAGELTYLLDRNDLSIEPYDKENSERMIAEGVASTCTLN